MKRLIVGLAAAAFALSALSTAAVAAPAAAKSKKMGSHKMASTMKCPACGMPMPMKKTAMMSVPVPIKGKVYYCCPQCPAGKAHMKKTM